MGSANAHMRKETVLVSSRGGLLTSNSNCTPPLKKWEKQLQQAQQPQQPPPSNTKKRPTPRKPASQVLKRNSDAVGVSSSVGTRARSHGSDPKRQKLKLLR